MEHWNVVRDDDGLAWLTFDRAGATTNTLSQAVLAEFNGVLDALHADPPKGLVIRSGKANGFIAGADVDEFGDIHDAQVARALVQRGWDTFERLAARRVSDAGADSRLLPRRRARAGACVPLSRRRRRARDATRPAGSDARHRAGLGRHQAVAPADRCTRGARSAADRQDDRRAQARSGSASPTNAFRRESWTIRRAACCWRGPRRARCAFPLSLTLLPLARRLIAAKARKAGRAPRAPRALSGAVRDSRLVGALRRQCAGAAGRRPGRHRRTARESHGGEPDPRVPPAGASEGARQGVGDRRSRACTSSAAGRWAATSPHGARCAD